MRSKISKIALTLTLVLCMTVSVFAVVSNVKAEDVTGYETVVMEEYTAEDAVALTSTPGKNGYLFAGWYSDAEEKTGDEANYLTTLEGVTGTVYAKFVPERVLSIKAQISTSLLDTNADNDSNAAIRFVTSVDSLNYQEIGFKLSYDKGDGNGTKSLTHSSKKVYKELYVLNTTTGQTESYTASEILAGESEFFKACILPGISSWENLEFTITPYWVTMDGTTVNGVTSVKTASMGFEKYEEIYVSADKGNDETGTGTSESPYATLEYAMYRVADNGTIYVMDDVEVSRAMYVQDDFNIFIATDSNAEEYATIYRGSSALNCNMINVYTGSTLHVENIVLDGRSEEAAATADTTAEGYLDTVASSTGSLIYNLGDVMMFEVTAQYAVKTGDHGAVIQSAGYTDDVYLYMSTFKYNKSAGQGGAVRMGGSTVNLEVDNCVFEGNVAEINGGALVSHSDTALINDCTFKNNTGGAGGGAFYSGTNSIVTMTNDEDNNVEALFSGNTAPNGGGISNGSGTITVTGYIFQGNEATGDTGTGGAAFASGATINVNDCKFDGNDAYRGGALYSGSKGTINVKGDLKSEMSVFTGNTADDYGGAIAMGTGWLTVDGYNFTGNSAATGGAIRDNSSSQTGSITNSVFTSNTSTSQGGAVWNQALTMTIDGCEFTKNESPKGGAVYVGANATTIEVKNSDFSGNKATSTNGGAISTEDNITISGCDFLSNTAVKIGGAVCVDNTATASTISGCTFTSNESTSSVGGAVALYGSDVATCIHNVSDCTFKTNTAKTQGGGLYCNKITVNANDCTFDTNTAETSGGGVYVAGSSIATFTDTAGTVKNTFTGNQATGSEYGGGAICVGSGQLIIDGHTFMNNKATSQVGGAIANRGSKLELKNTVWFEGNQGTRGGAIHMNSTTGTLTVSSGTITIKGNTATEHGGGIYKSGAMNVTGGTINLEGNTATNNGGAICNNNGTMTVTGGSMAFTENQAAYGAGIYVNASSVNITGGTHTFTSNAAGTYGGAIYIKSGDYTAKVSNTTFTSNTAKAAGAICNFGIFEATDCTFTTNSATSGEGGAIYTNKTTTVNDCKFNRNTASKNGGAIQMSGGTLTLNTTDTSSVEATFTNNTATTYGGAIYLFAGTINMNGVYTFSDNSPVDMHINIAKSPVFNNTAEATVETANVE